MACRIVVILAAMRLRLAATAMAASGRAGIPDSR
jgi:hypothetical protein